MATSSVSSNLLPSSSSRPIGSASQDSPCRLPLASRIFVRNLPYSTGEATLIKLFSKFGQIVEIKLAREEETWRSKGYAFIQYSSQEQAVLALEEMDRKRFEGRIIYAEIAKPLRNEFGDYPIGSGPPQQLHAVIPSAI
ncbi:small RNA-binding protein 11, chloroplastic-like isoform X1 [Zingiber officinale]|nr:small RNA-binding protein 11, chloroplastic-like isoform X1 [Zingiber officinale]